MIHVYILNSILIMLYILNMYTEGKKKRLEEVQMLKNLPAMLETQVRSLSQEDPLEKEMASHSSILAWRIQWTEEPGRLQSMASQKVGHD